MARRLRTPLAKILELFERQIVAREVQQRIEQHRAMSRGKEKAIAILPFWVLWIVSQETRPKHVSHRRGAER